MNKEEERLISYNYNEFGQEFGDLMVDIRNERDKYKEVLDKIKEYAQELRFFDNESVEFEISNKILELLEEIE